MAHEPGQHQQHRTVIQVNSPCCLGLVFNLCLVGTGPEGCWLSWSILQIDLNESKEDWCFSLSQVTLGRDRNSESGHALEDPGGFFFENLVNYKGFFRFSSRVLRIPAPSSTFFGQQQGRKGSLLVCPSLERKERIEGIGKGLSISLAHSEQLVCFLGAQHWLPQMRQ